MTYASEKKEFDAKYARRELQAGGGTFRYILAGEPAKGDLVFLNGGMDLSEMWMRYVEPLAQDFRVLLFDYPLELKKNRDTVEGMRAFFEALGIASPVLIGEGYGGMLAQLYAQRYPDGVRGLILLSTGALDKEMIKALKKEYTFAPFMLLYMRFCNYGKLKKKWIETGIGYACHESRDNRAYAAEFWEAVMEDYTRERDLHVTSLMGDVRKQKPLTEKDFRTLEGKVLLITPRDDFFSKEDKEKLGSFMHRPKLYCIRGGQMASVLHYEDYVRAIQKFMDDPAFA